MSIADKLLYLNETKRQLREAINTAFGSNLTEDTPFSEYANTPGLWTPAMLFTEGEVGVWYDPSDLSTMFQDSAGTIPVQSPGDPVGLIMDKSLGRELGEEIQPNGDFDNNIDGWETSYWQWDAGSAYHPPSSNFNTLRTTDITHLRGSFIQIEVEVEILSGVLRLQYRTESDGPTSAGVDSYPMGSVSGISNSGTYRVLSRIPNNASTLGFGRNTVGESSEFRIKRVSMRELYGNHGTQPISSARPTYQSDGISHWLELDGIDDHLLVSSMGTPLSMFSSELLLAAATKAVSPGGIVTRGSAIVGTHGVNYGYLHQDQSNARSRFRFWESSTSAADFNILIEPVGFKRVQGMNWDGTIADVYTNGSLIRTEWDIPIVTGSETYVGVYRGGGPSYWGGSLYGLVIRSTHTKKYGALERYLAMKAELQL